MTSIKLYEVGYGETGHGSVTIMLNNGGFFLIREGIPSEDGEEDVDDPGIEISMADMEAFCRAALAHIERQKSVPEPEPEPGAENIKIMDIGVSMRLHNRLQSIFSGYYTGWPKINIEDITLGDIAKHSEREFLKFRHFGKKTLYQLEDILLKHNLDFKN